jgi:hypothetical protein
MADECLPGVNAPSDNIVGRVWYKGGSAKYKVDDGGNSKNTIAIIREVNVRSPLFEPHWSCYIV